MKALIVFHSVCGNTYLLAKRYKSALSMFGAEADIFRVKDETMDKLTVELGADTHLVKEIKSIPVWNSTAEVYKNYDALFLGSPTYFGNVSAQIKAFMDSFLILYGQQKPYGFPFGAFTTYSSAQGGAQLCLQAMNVFAMHMGMNVITVPGELECAPLSAYGAAHCSGDNSDIRPDELLLMAIDHYIKRFSERAS